MAQAVSVPTPRVKPVAQPAVPLPSASAAIKSSDPTYDAETFQRISAAMLSYSVL